MATILLGKDYTVTGSLQNVSELSMTIEAESLDVTTRTGSLPIKHVRAGLQAKTFTCKILALADTVYSVGSSQTLTLPDGTFTVIVTQASRTEPKEGVVTYDLTLKPGTASTTTVDM